MQRYRYVGPDDIREKSRNLPIGLRVRAEQDVLDWVMRSEQQVDSDGWVTVTFVIDAEGELRIADRHSEHVACAGGGKVRSAGEMTFEISGNEVEVVEVSNQSTGYCPEPTSWPEVAAALDRIGLPHPGGFTFEVIFRQCPKCGQ